MVGDGDVLWVQQLGGPVARIDRAGGVRLHPSGGRDLQTVSAHGAWCLGEVPHTDVCDHPDTPPAEVRGAGRVTVALAGGGAREVEVDAPAVEARSMNGDLYLRVETGEWNRRKLGPRVCWALEPLTRWLHLPAGDPVPDRFAGARHATDVVPPTRPSLRNGGQRWGIPWLQSFRGSRSSPEHLVEAAGEPAGALRWRVGLDREHAVRPLRSTAVARDPDSGAEVLRVDLGPGEVRAMVGSADHLWLVIDQPRRVASDNPPAPAAVVRLDARDGTVEPVLSADAVDIRDACWPLPPRRDDASAYEETWRASLVADYFSDEAGWVPNPRRAILVGEWPDTHVHILFTSQRHPGKRLRRILALYDELGRQVPPLYGNSQLDESLASGAMPYRTPGADPGLFDL